jgi:hypothetical protein
MTTIDNNSDSESNNNDTSSNSESNNDNIKICSKKTCRHEFTAFLTDTGKDANNCKKCYEYAKAIRLKNKENGIKPWQQYRKKKREEDQDAFLKHNADVMQKWRDKNLDKMEQIYKDKKQNKKYVLKNYKNEALYKGIPWQLTNEEAFVFFDSNCFYCNELDQNKLMGIDRMRLNVFYIKKDCVACCKMCNNMKISLDWNIFVHMCMHISVFNNQIDGELNHNLFIHGSSSDINSYKSRATKKNLLFELTNKQFNKLINDPCYICGREPITDRTNGIDRLNNLIGYILSNCKSCCRTCNYMKRDLSYDEFINKCKLIAKNFTIENIKINYKKDNFDIIARSKFIKLTKEEKATRTKELRETRVNNTKEKYMKMEF